MSAIYILSWIFLALGGISFFVVLVDICMGRYQPMSIMNLAWPITVLYSGPIGLYMYFKYARAHKMKMGQLPKPRKEKKKPSWVQTYISSTHCGAGCALADIIGEIAIFWIGIKIFHHTLWASFFIDFGLALAFGFLFQYWNIKPMHPRKSFKSILLASIKADFLSLLTFQLGMYSWLLAAHFIYGDSFKANQPLYWFMMQIGLTIGLITTYPINSWLIRSGIKKPCH